MAATIEHLPPEILELIFQELSLKDINNCSQTCLWWSYCIEEFFKNKGKCNYFHTSKYTYYLFRHDNYEFCKNQ